MPDFHPELARMARFLPRGLAGPRLTPILRRLGGLAKPKPRAGVNVDRVGERLRVYRPDIVTTDAAMLWIHGGGMVMGTAQADDPVASEFARDLGILVASVDYRLAPEDPFPAAVEDCYEGLRWLHDQDDLDTNRIAVAGASAGGGLAASLAQVALDRGELPIAFQLLVYPMLDNLSATRDDIDTSGHRVWSQKSNRYGWESYLGGGSATAPAVPARRDDLSGLPRAWIGVGDLDLFHDEDVAYAERLRAAGVACDLEIVPGAFHGFDRVAATTDVSRRFIDAQLAAVRVGLALPSAPVTGP